MRMLNVRKLAYAAAATVPLFAVGAHAAGPGAGEPALSVVPAPPDSFNPLAASPADRAKYRLPPAPDAVRAPEAYSAWVHAMTMPTRREAATMTHTGRFNGPNMPIGPVTGLFNSKHAVASSSIGWSGTSVVNLANPFQMEEVQAIFTIPTAHQPSNTCQTAASPGPGPGPGPGPQGPGATGIPTYSSEWVGIDGNGSNDVLQAGTEIDTTCSNKTTTPAYSTWIEWYPNDEVTVSSPAVSAGDLLQVNVWSTSPTAAVAYFLNLSTGVAATYQLTAPPGTQLVGNSVEWVVELPEVSGVSSFNLTNYVGSAWPLGVAWNYGAPAPTYYYAGGVPAQGTLQVISLIGANGTVLSAPTILSNESLFFSSYPSGCWSSTNSTC